MTDEEIERLQVLTKKWPFVAYPDVERALDALTAARQRTAELEAALENERCTRYAKRLGSPKLKRSDCWNCRGTGRLHDLGGSNLCHMCEP
jgi:hypothetical protein